MPRVSDLHIVNVASRTRPRHGPPWLLQGALHIGPISWLISVLGCRLSICIDTARDLRLGMSVCPGRLKLKSIHATRSAKGRAAGHAEPESFKVWQLRCAAWCSSHPDASREYGRSRREHLGLRD